ncbi:MAG: hypothetical protein JST22_21550 [Bacteroidetes bacterium]|nr:hypothetical protein [Bacteroidota bacterium]
MMIPRTTSPAGVVSVWISAAIMVAASHQARADWTHVRDMVRSGEQQRDDDERESTFRSAWTLSQASVKANPNSSNEHLWAAIAAGRLAVVSSTGERVRLSREVKYHAESAIELDPRNGQAYMVLGVWHFYVADLGWLQRNAAKLLYGGVPAASYAEAVSNLTRALQIGVENPVEVYYIRGRAYEAMENRRAAQADYRACLAGKARTASERKAQQDARERLE